jgi:hypothetical protein
MPSVLLNSFNQYVRYFDCPSVVRFTTLAIHQQKRGWTGRPERPVSIRSRRVHSALLPKWGPMARQSPCEEGPLFGRLATSLRID